MLLILYASYTTKTTSYKEVKERTTDTHLMLYKNGNEKKNSC